MMTLTFGVFTFSVASPILPGLDWTGLDWTVCMRSLTCAVEALFFVARQDVVGGFHSHHHRVIHVADFITPCAEASAGINPLLEQRRLQHGKGLVAAERRNGIRISHDAMIARDDEPTVGFLEHFRLNQS